MAGSAAPAKESEAEGIVDPGFVQDAKTKSVNTASIPTLTAKCVAKERLQKNFDSMPLRLDLILTCNKKETKQNVRDPRKKTWTGY